MYEYEEKLSKDEAEQRTYHYTLERYPIYYYPEILNTFNSIIKTAITN
jgi:hypothetical protein